MAYNDSAVLKCGQIIKYTVNFSVGLSKFCCTNGLKCLGSWKLSGDSNTNLPQFHKPHL